ncbi:protein SMALL AUXIN UP-REGULATED RNA 12-like [Cryptomeria japonica]|uniref:protein SMALL AUXIN UP-REGULATED RNA 12-like n=1 Tax=Cryptomeria japonica TaxID=3369 RepID=UPI0027DA36CF|nr:protein SMALL AUXIN UP-REGULATED RNA 12-like [Cryptomeria japonica]
MARSKGNPQVLIVKHIIRVLCRFVNSIKANGYALSSKSRIHFSSRDEFLNGSCGGLPADIPKRHCSVYVGSEQSRYIIPTKYLNHSLFRELLDKAEEEYGFDHQMGLTIPCEEVAFQYLTSMLRKRMYELKVFHP